MKRLTTLMTATAASAFACATTALAGAAAMAQDEYPQNTETHMETQTDAHVDGQLETEMDVHKDDDHLDTEMTVEGDAHAPRRNETIQDNDLLREGAEAWDNSDLDRAPYTDDHHWIGLRVTSEEGTRIGEIERVRLSAEGEVEAIVVEYGGVLDVGGREVQINADAVSFAPEGDRPIAVIAYSQAEFEAMPDFNEDAASEYPLSDDDYGDNENEQELDDGPADSGL